jgi:YidC/Oxa1 family membrane protein insertase
MASGMAAGWRCAGSADVIPGASAATILFRKPSMDRKSIAVLIVSVAILFVWFKIVPKLLPPGPPPPPRATNNLAALTNQPGPAEQTNLPAPPPSTVLAPTNLTAPVVSTNEPEQLETLQTAEAVYTFTSHGGGLKRVDLKKYFERGDDGPGATPMVALNGRGAVPVLALRGGEAMTGDGLYKLTSLSSNSLRAEKKLTNGLVISKQFTLGSNYVLSATVRFENSSGLPLVLPEHFWAAGTASTRDPLEDPTLLGASWFNGVKDERVDPAWFENRSFGGCLSGATPAPRLVYSAGYSNVFWSAVHNQFFALALVPSTNEIATQIWVRRLNLPPLPPVNGRSAPPFGYEAALACPSATLAPGQTVTREFMLYAGPKEYKTLARLGHNLDVIMGYSGPFGWFAKALLLSMNGLYSVVPQYGIDIILITFIIKLLFWPLTQAGTRSMKRMQALQPKMKELQEKYKDDPAKMNRKLMEFMKENKVSPLGGCLPMLIQIPVFIGFYQMIRTAIELRGVHFLWATDLSRPDTIAYLPGFGFPINPLPIVMGATMLWQARMTPPTPGVDPTQQKIMKYMPMIFMVFLYNFSAGLTLYWTVQNLLTIAQMKLTKTQPATDKGAPATLLPRKRR